MGGVRQWPEEIVVIHTELHEVLHAGDESQDPGEFAVAAVLGADVEELDLAVHPKVRTYDSPQLVPRQRQALQVREQAGVAEEVWEDVVHVDVVGREAPEAAASGHVVLEDRRVGHVVVVDGERLERRERGEEAVGDVQEPVGAEVEDAEAGERLPQAGQLEAAADLVEAEVELDKGREQAEVGGGKRAGEPAAAGIDGGDAARAVAANAGRPRCRRMGRASGRPSRATWRRRSSPRWISWPRRRQRSSAPQVGAPTRRRNTTD